MRFSVAGACRRGRADERDVCLDGAQHEVRHRPLRPLPVRARLRLPRRSRVHATSSIRPLSVAGDLNDGRTGANPSSRSGSSPPATAASSPCSTARTSCSPSPVRSTSPTSSRRRRREVAGPYDLSLVEGSITTPHDEERIQEVRRQSRRAGHDRRLRHRRRHPGAAQLRRRRRLHRGRSTRGRTNRDARHLDADLGSREGRLRAARLPDQQAPAGRGDHRVPGRPQARRSPPHSVCIECKLAGNVCVMVAHGTPCLGPVTHAGCGALCPTYDRGCYGCYRADGDAEHRVAVEEARRARHDRARYPPPLPHLQCRQRAVPCGSRAP